MLSVLLTRSGRHDPSSYSVPCWRQAFPDVGLAAELFRSHNRRDRGRGRGETIDSANYRAGDFPDRQRRGGGSVGVDLDRCGPATADTRRFLHHAWPHDMFWGVSRLRSQHRRERKCHLTEGASGGQRARDKSSARAWRRSKRRLLWPRLSAPARISGPSGCIPNTD